MTSTSLGVWTIALIDSWAWGATRKDVAVGTLALGCAAATGFVAARANERPYDEVWSVVRGSILYALIAGAVGRWWNRRWTRGSLAPHRRRLEVLLKELDD